MSDSAQPKIYLKSPQLFELAKFSSDLAEVLDRFEVACVRLALGADDEETLSRSGDVIRDVCHQRDVAMVIDQHFRLAEKLGFDGVHLTDGSRQVRIARKALGRDAIVGAFCGTSRHDGMTAGEIGADYVSLGPLTVTDALGDGSMAEADLFRWWSEMIEVPVVAEGGLTAPAIGEIGQYVDFLCLGDEIWSAHDGPVAALEGVLRQL